MSKAQSAPSYSEVFSTGLREEKEVMDLRRLHLVGRRGFHE